MTLPPPRTAPAAPPHPLAAVASRALGWSFVNTVVSRVGTLAIGVVLARLLGPEEFGTFAIAMVAMMAVLSFNELGVSLAIVRWPGDPREIAPTVATISIVSSAVLVAGLCAVAEPFAAAMGDPGAAGVVRLMSLAVLVNGLVATPAALLQREFQAGRRLVADQVNTWLGAGVSVVLALMGLGAMSLAVGRLVGSVAAATLLLRWSPQPFRLGLDRGRARQLLRFGAPLAAASAVVFAGNYADQLVAGATLGSLALGFYVLAFNLASWPVSIFSQPLRSVAPAAFARLQDDLEVMNRTFRTVLGLLAAAALPTCALLAGAATPIVRLVYGAAWTPAAAVLTWLAVVAGCRICFELAYDFLVVRGRSRGILANQVCWLVAAVPALVVGGRQGGLVGIAVAQLVLALAVSAPLFLVQLRRCDVPVGRVLSRLVEPVAVSLLVGVAAATVSRAVDGALLACLLAGLCGLAGTAVLALRRRRDLATLGLLAEKPPADAPVPVV